MMPSEKPKTFDLRQVLDFHETICRQARELVEKKGHDYCADQQASGDTLFNLRVAHLLGLVNSPARSVLVRLTDKMMRLISLTEPGRHAQVAGESLSDTVLDIINYAIYVDVLERERAMNTP